MRERAPEAFPDELRPHARTVMRVLRELAREKPNGKEVKALAIGNVIMARPHKPLVKAVFDYAAWWHSQSGYRQHKDVVAGYRNWLDHSDDLAGVERLTDDGRPLPEAAATSTVRTLERDERRARRMAAAERVIRGEDR